MLTYSNPRLDAVIENWPDGGDRVTAHFYIEANPRGERGCRVTTGKPKKLTFAKKVRIVDGNDGRTYLIELTEFGHISVMRGDMRFEQESLFPNEPRYAELRAMFDQEQRTAEAGEPQS